MREVLSIIQQSLKDLWEDFVLLVALNVIWSIALVLPLIPILTLGVAQFLLALILAIILLLPLPIISGGLWFVTNQITRGVAVSWRTFTEGARRYWAKSLLVSLANIFALLMLASNLQFYATVLEGMVANFALVIWALLGGYWLLMQVFWFPMIMELESEKVLLALRNALLMGIVTPGFSLVLSLILVVLIVLGIALTLPFFVFLVSLLMLIANRATRSRLDFAREKAEKLEEAEE